MSVFQFKYFSVKNEKSAMKVNTDGVLLGAAVNVFPEDRKILDVGTGTGFIALMLAQRRAFLTKTGNNQKLEDTPQEITGGIKTKESDYYKSREEPFIVEAIEIDQVSAEEAKQNFEASQWAENLKVFPLGLSDFENLLSDLVLNERSLDISERESEISELGQGKSKTELNFNNINSEVSQQLRGRKYDLIVSNPPYFENSILAPNQRRSTARHTTDLSYRELVEFASKHLAESGRLAMILPAEQEKDVLRYGRMNSLHLHSILRVRTVERKPANRIIIELSRQKQPNPKDSILTVQKEGQYSAEYLSLTKDFYLFA